MRETGGTRTKRISKRVQPRWVDLPVTWDRPQAHVPPALRDSDVRQDPDRSLEPSTSNVCVQPFSIASAPVQRFSQPLESQLRTSSAALFQRAPLFQRCNPPLHLLPAFALPASLHPSFPLHDPLFFIAHLSYPIHAESLLSS